MSCYTVTKLCTFVEDHNYLLFLKVVQKCCSLKTLNDQILKKKFYILINRSVLKKKYKWDPQPDRGELTARGGVAPSENIGGFYP